MFRPIYFKENDCKLILMKNRHEELIEINLDVNEVEKVTFNVEEPATMIINVPMYINRFMGSTDQKIKNPVFDLIKGKMQLVLEINNDKYKFFVDSIKENEKKEGSVKTITCREWQQTLSKINCNMKEGVITRQLYRGTNQLEVGEGMLDLFVNSCKGWSVGHVDQKAQQELTMTASSEKVILYENLTIDEVKVNTTDEPNNWLFNRDISINIGDKPLNMTISWDTTVYDTNGKVYINATNEHNFSNLPYAVKNIKAEYIVTPRYPYGIKYTITYINDTTEEFSFAFINCKGLKLVAKTVNVVYELGDFVENWVTKYRSFQAQTTSWLTMLSQIEEMFDCIITFDSYNQIINAYDKSTFGKETGLYLSYDNALKEITKEKKIEDIVTRLVVESNNTSIASVNPLGTDYIESFKYFQNAGIMSNELTYAMEQYDKLLALKDKEFDTIKIDLYAKNQQITLVTGRLTSLENKLTAENAILSSYIKFKNDAPENEKDAWAKKQAEQQAIVADLELQIALAKKELEKLNKEADALQKSLTQIGIDIKKENAVFNGEKLFSEALLLELSDYIIESTISDEVYLTSTALYNHAKKTLDDMQSVVVDFSIADANVDFLNRLRTPNGFGDFIFLGAKVDIEDRSGELVGTDGRVILYGFDYNPKLNRITNLQFTNNKEKPVSALKAIGNIRQAVNATKSLTDFYKSTWEQTRDQVIDVGNIINNGLDLAAQKIRSQTSKNIIDMTEAGIFLIDAKDTKNQLGMINDLICMTDDKWKTSRIAISPEGIIADQLIGRVILGQELYISNGDFGFLVRENGLTIRDKAGSDKIFLGLNNGEPTFKLGMNKQQDHLMWENGELSIRAKKISIGADDVVTSTTLSIEVGKIQTQIKDTENSLQSSITQTASDIRTEIKDTKDGLESSINQTASSIRTELKDTKNDLESSITQTAKDIRLEVSDVKSGLESSISQTASDIRLEVSTTDSNLRSLISQTKSDIELSVSNEVKDLRASIKVNADNITSTVENTKRSGIELLPQGFRRNSSSGYFSSYNTHHVNEWGLYTTGREWVGTDFIAIDPLLPLSYYFYVQNTGGRNPLTYVGIEQHDWKKQPIGANASTIYFIHEKFTGYKTVSGVLEAGALDSNTKFIKFRFLTNWDDSGIAESYIHEMSLKQLANINSSTQIAQMDDRITSTVTSISTVDGKVNSAQSQIDQQATQIASKVDVNGVKSIIQQNPESVRIGFNGISNYFDLNAQRLRVGHVDGSYTEIGQHGIMYFAHGSGNRYHNLMKQGWLGQIQGTQWSRTISLPPEFRGKAFSVIVSVTEVNAINTHDVIKHFKVTVPHDTVDYANGTFIINMSAVAYWVPGQQLATAIQSDISWIAIA